MSRRKLIVTSPGEQEYFEVTTGGPRKAYNRRRIRNRFAKRAIEDYAPLKSEWYQKIICEIGPARQRLGLSQMSLAGMLGTSQSALSRLETGRANPTVELLDRLFSILNISIEVTVK